jgi:hypothetical protein
MSIGERRIPGQSPSFLMPRAAPMCARADGGDRQVGRRDLSVRCGLARHSCTVVGRVGSAAEAKPHIAWRLRAADRVEAAYGPSPNLVVLAVHATPLPSSARAWPRRAVYLRRCAEAIRPPAYVATVLGMTGR